MEIKKNTLQFLLVAAAMVVGCKERYEPPATKGNPNFLVVDGFLNNSSDTTFIRLSRTRNLDSNLLNSGERNADMFVEDNTGNTVYHFQEINDDGKYIIPGMNLDMSSKYKLYIRTSDGKEYISDEITVVQTPPIDSISWQKTEKGVTIFTNTHDPSGKAKYYRWDYTETYRYHATFISNNKYENGLVIPRQPDEYFYVCWKTNDSKNLLLASTIKLSEDIIYQNPIRSIEPNAIELSDKYSILVRQYTLTEQAFDYLQNLRRVSEQVGTLFDAQPSQLTGNIHCVNNVDEPVLGFITACNRSSERIYITRYEVDPWTFGYSCNKIQVSPDRDSLDAYFGAAGYIPLDPVNPLSPRSAIYGAKRDCVDCTIFGGTTVKPDFWP